MWKYIKMKRTEGKKERALSGIGYERSSLGVPAAPLLLAKVWRNSVPRLQGYPIAYVGYSIACA